MNTQRPHRQSFRKQLYDILEQSRYGDRAGRLVEAFILTLILVNILAVILESVPELDRRFHVWFAAIEWISFVVFTIEYALRLYVAVEHEPYKHLPPFRARWRYATSPAGLVDLIAILPFWFGFVAPEETRIVLVLRVFRFLKIARYSRSMQSLLDTIYEERRALGGCVLIVTGVTIISATLMHAVEGGVQPDKFGTIPDAMWWAIVTLGTVGYGDVVPITPLGKLVTVFAIVVGFAMIALPVAIVSRAFTDEVRRRDFIVTWAMLARVPLFAHLGASEIVDIMRLLRAQAIEAGEVLVRRGDPASSMYFITAGEVEIELPSQRVRLSNGTFFGEIALLHRTKRSGTVTATRKTKLLALDAQDFHALIERLPDLAAHVKDTAEARLADTAELLKGDLAPAEIAQAERD